MKEQASQAEFEIIRRYFARDDLAFPRAGVTLGIGDDAALIDVPPGKQLAMSMDVLVADVHFPSSADPALIANRALAVNLSDMAAMAAEPLCFTLGLVLPDANESWLESFSIGLEPLARRYNCPLVGGDTSGGPLAIAIQVQGLVDRGRAARRSAARPGDKIFVTGTLGDAAIALLTLGLSSHLGADFALAKDKLSAQTQSYFADAYYKPQPQVELALAATSLLSSCIDISDGLHGDLSHILEASGLAANVHLAAIPFSEYSQTCTDAAARLRAALFGGDDYGLCFTLDGSDCAELERIATSLGVQLSCIGEIVEGAGIRYLDEDGAGVELDAQAYQHFNFQPAD